MTEYNIYCDESCHLQHEKYDDHNRYMVIGGVYCPLHLKNDIFTRIKNIKHKHGIKNAEMKWVKVSKNKLSAYLELMDLFFDIHELNFRAVIIDKEQLNHTAFGQSHDTFYHKMYYTMLNYIVDNQDTYNIYLDIKDTKGSRKVSKLQDILRHHNNIKQCQQIRSHEVVLMELADILIGAISYINRYGKNGQSDAKITLTDYIINTSKQNLTSKSPHYEKKINVLLWQGQNA